MKNQKNTAMLAVLLFMGLVIGSGAAMAAYTANPRNPTTYWMGANGVWQTDATFEARSAGGLTRYAKRTVPLTAGTLGKLVKAAMGGPAGLAITAAMVGYAIWDGTNWIDPAEIITHTKPAEGWQSVNLSCLNPEQAGKKGIDYGWTLITDGQTDHPDYPAAPAGSILLNYCTENPPYYPHLGAWPQKRFVPVTTVEPDTIDAQPGQTTTFTDEQIGTKIAETPTLTKQIGNDAISRGTWAGGNWPEMEQAAADIAASLDRIDSGTATQADIDAEKAMYAEPAPATAAEPQAIPDDYAREPTLQAVRDEATAIKNNTQALVDTLGNDGSNLPPWEPPTLPADPVPDWDYTGQFTAFWDWAKGLFPFSFLLSPLTAFGGTAPPPIPDFSITVLGNSQTLSLQPVSVVFTWIRTANGILLLFGFYLIGLSIARRFI